MFLGKASMTGWPYSSSLLPSENLLKGLLSLQLEDELKISSQWIILFGLPNSSYLSVVLGSLVFTYGTDKARINTKFKWILTNYKFELYQESVDKCNTQGYFPSFYLYSSLDTTDK